MPTWFWVAVVVIVLVGAIGLALARIAGMSDERAGMK